MNKRIEIAGLRIKFFNNSGNFPPHLEAAIERFEADIEFWVRKFARENNLQYEMDGE